MTSGWLNLRSRSARMRSSSTFVWLPSGNPFGYSRSTQSSHEIYRNSTTTKAMFSAFRLPWEFVKPRDENPLHSTVVIRFVDLYLDPRRERPKGGRAA